MECGGPGRGDVGLAVRKHRDFVPTVGERREPGAEVVSQGEIRKEGAGEKGSYVKRFRDA